MADQVPQGTVQDVLDWVGQDPTRAQQALQAERAGSNRSTLIDKLEALSATQEADVSEETTTAEEAEVEEAEEVPAPEQPTEVQLDPADRNVVIQPIAVRDVDVEVPDDADMTPAPPEPEEGAEEQAETLGGEQVEYLQVAGGTNGVVVSLNGTAFALNTQTALALKGAVDKAVAGLNF